MYSSATSLFSGSLRAELDRKIRAAIDKIQRSAIDGLDDVGTISSGVKVPIVCRSEIGMATTGGDDKVAVTVTVPVIGDESLLTLAPNGIDRRVIAIKLTDDLNWMADGHSEGGSFESARWTNGGSGDDARAGFTFRTSFDAGVPTAEVREQIKEIIDWVEATLSLSERQIEEFETTWESRISEAVRKRRSSLETASRLDDELGRGI